MTSLLTVQMPVLNIQHLVTALGQQVRNDVFRVTDSARAIADDPDPYSEMVHNPTLELKTLIDVVQKEFRVRW